MQGKAANKMQPPQYDHSDINGIAKLSNAGYFYTDSSFKTYQLNRTGLKCLNYGYWKNLRIIFEKMIHAKVSTLK